MWSGLLVRLPSSSTNHAPVRAGGPTRVEICPPVSLLSDRPSWADRLLDWLGQGWHTATPRIADADESRPPAGITPLGIVRLEFVGVLDDIATRQAADLALRIGKARSLRELWHLRAEVFSVVSCHMDEREARERMTRLNRHFPARAPRSGFGGFDATPHTHHDA
jgi:hypothetical protein